MKRFCKFLREQAMKIIHFERKKKIPSANEQQELNEKTNFS